MKNQKIFFCFLDRSYRNRKGHEIWGHVEAILRVLELIFGRGGVEHPPVPNRVKYSANFALFARLLLENGEKLIFFLFLNICFQ